MKIACRFTKSLLDREPTQSRQQRNPHQHGGSPAPLDPGAADLFRRKGRGYGHPARLDVRRLPCRARPHREALARDAPAGPGPQRQAGLLPLHGVPDRPGPGERLAGHRSLRRGQAGLLAAGRRLRCPGRGRARPGAGQWRPGPAGGLLHGLHRHHRPGRHGIRPALRVRHVQPADRQRAAGRGARLLAGQRQSLGVHAPRAVLHGAFRRPAHLRRVRRGAVGRHRGSDRHRLRQRRSGLWHEQRGHDAAVGGAGQFGHEPRGLQPRRLHGCGGGQEPVRERHPRAVPRGQHGARQGTAPAPGIFLRQCVDAGHGAPLPAQPRQFRCAARQGGRPPERHPPGPGHPRADAPADRRAQRALGRCLVAVHAQSSPTPTTP